MTDAKQRRAASYRANAPAFHADYPPLFVEAALVGKRLRFAKLGLLLEYRESFHSPTLGELCHSGVVIAVAPWCHVRIGSLWAWKASELEAIA
jgi:hypothetical protein